MLFNNYKLRRDTQLDEVVERARRFGVKGSAPSFLYSYPSCGPGGAVSGQRVGTFFNRLGRF